MAKRSTKTGKGVSKAKQKRKTSEAPLYDEEYRIKRILDETKDHYRVAWEDSWIPKTWANPEAIRSWTDAKNKELTSDPIESTGDTNGLHLRDHITSQTSSLKRIDGNPSRQQRVIRESLSPAPPPVSPYVAPSHLRTGIDKSSGETKTSTDSCPPRRAPIILRLRPLPSSQASQNANGAQNLSSAESGANKTGTQSPRQRRESSSSLSDWDPRVTEGDENRYENNGFSLINSPAAQGRDSPVPAADRPSNPALSATPGLNDPETFNDTIKPAQDLHTSIPVLRSQSPETRAITTSQLLRPSFSPLTPLPGTILPSAPLSTADSADIQSSLPSIQSQLSQRSGAVTSPRKTIEPSPNIPKHISHRMSQQNSTTQPEAVAAVVASHPHLLEEVPINMAVPPRSPLLRLEGRRSPSAVPAIEPPHRFTREEQNTSERYRSLRPDTDEAAREVFETAESYDHAETTSNFHTLAVPFLGHQRDQYQTTSPSNVLDLLDSVADHSNSETMQKAQRLIRRLKEIALHPDLDNEETFTQYDVAASRQADWDIQCSSKFRFLNDLCSKLKESSIRVAISCEPGVVAGKVETFLSGRKVTIGHIFQPSNTASFDAVITTPTALGQITEYAPSLVIDLDGYEVDHLSQWAESAPCPVISLVVPCTVQHIERSLQADISAVVRTVVAIREIKRLRHEAGRSSEDCVTSREAATRIADMLTKKDNSIEWTLPELGHIHIPENEYIIEGKSLQNGAMHQGEKRALDTDEESPSKRAKLAEDTGLPMTVNLSEIEAAPPIIAGLPSNSLSNGVDLDIDAPLRKVLTEEQQRRIEIENDLSELQYRLEDMRTELYTTIKARDSAITTAKTALERVNVQASVESAARKEVVKLRADVVELNAKLLESSIPERVEIEKERQIAQQAIADAQKATVRFESMKKDLDYAKSMYQEASSQAQTLASQNAEMEQRLTVAEKAASAEKGRVRQLTFDTFTKNLRRENKQLKILLESRESALKFRDEELARLKDASRGRMGTRNTSVPRSPRMNSPMKAMDGSRTISRHGSPAPGEVRERGRLHPLRNG